MSGSSDAGAADYQKMIEENRRRNKEMLEQSMAEFYKLYPDMKAEVEMARKQREADMQKTQLKFTPKLVTRRKIEDPSFKIAGLKRRQVAKTPTRRSSRLSNTGIEVINENKSGDSNDDDEEEEEEEDENPKKRRRLSEKTPRRSYSLGTRATQVPKIPVESVDEKLISKIAYTSQKKWCSVKGTTCHQCRQKTTDTKSVCRSGSCVGVRGMFCGVCLKNRYGEDVAEVLKDPNWRCPPCRGDCNCSICRTREGKTPTGIMVPFIRQKGYTHLREYLNKNPEDDE